MPIQKTTVPVFKMYEVPQCPYCKTPFFLHHGQGESYETWRQGCACEPVGKESYSRTYIPQDGRWWMEGYFHGEKIGKPIVLQCVLCSRPMTEGEEAFSGCMGKHNYCGYAHVLCYEQMLAEKVQAEQDAQAASQGVSIAFWFSIATKLRAAPNTGHYDGETRLVPQELPPFPKGSVVYEMYRMPFAMSYVAIPVREDAEIWWRDATANDQVAIEFHWYDPGKKREQAARSWRGKEFSVVESAARMAEWDAERNNDIYNDMQGEKTR